MGCVDAAELLTEMVRIESVSGDENALATFLERRLRDIGFEARLDDAGNVVAAWGEGAHHTALVGHLDTAPGRLAVANDGVLVHGRGAVDAKGALAAAICAVSRQRRDGDHRYTLVGAVEEESTSAGARHLATAMSPPDALIILEPSGWEGITIGYKGCVRAVWSVQQPTGHGAGPCPSAGDRAVAFVRALQDHARSWSGDRGIFDRLDVRVLDMHASSDGIKDRARVDIGLRVPLAYDTDSLIADVRNAARDATVDIVNVEPPVRTDRGSALARGLVDAIRAHGGAPRFKLKTGTSDLNVLVPAWRCAAVAYGPGDSRLDHAPDEHLDLRELERAVQVLTTAIAA